MKKLIFGINVVCMLAILLSTISMQGMEQDYAQLALQAKEYNETKCLLTSLLHEILIEIFPYCIDNNKEQTSLENSIKNFLVLRTTCKNLNALLTFEIIGNLHDPFIINIKNPIFLKLKRRQIASRAERYTAYNSTDCRLTRLPDSTLIKFFSYCLSQHKDEATLQSDIKNFMKLSITCKKMNKLLTFEAIGSLCKTYTQSDKNMFLTKLIKKMQWNGHPKRGDEMPALILICAGVDPNQISIPSTILEAALRNHYEQLIITLLEHNTDPNITTQYGTPVFFYAQTAKVAQMLIDKGINVHATDKEGLNVLWNIMYDDYNGSIELRELYIKHGVDASTLSNAPYNRCLLHELAKPFRMPSIDNFYKKSVLLLDTIPHMINALDYKGQTPLDVAQAAYEEKTRKGYDDIPKALAKLSTLLIERDGLTAQQLAQNEAQLQLEHK